MDSIIHRASDLSARIRALRTAAGLSQEALARRADCSTVYVGLIETGSYKPLESDVIPRILRALNDVDPGTSNPEADKEKTGATVLAH